MPTSRYDAMPKVTTTAVCLVTVLYNSEAALPAFLDSLRTQTLKDWHLVAVDNASRDRSLKVVTEMADPRITIVPNTMNLGFARAANQGLQTGTETGARFLVVINNDTVFGPDFLAGLVAARDALQARVIAPRVMLLNDPARAWYAGGHLDKGWVFSNVHEAYDPADTRDHRLVEFASGCCLGIERDVLEQVGFFDESFFVYWEDTDFCMRLRQAGVPIHYVRDPHLLHEGGASSGGENTSSHHRLYYHSYAQLLRKHFGLARALGTTLRLIRQELARPSPDRGKLLIIVRTMLAGIAAPLRPVRYLTAGPSDLKDVPLQPEGQR